MYPDTNKITLDTYSKMPITKEQALDICKSGKFYRQNTNRAGIPERNIFCDYCNQSGLMGSWKIIDTYDLCNNCYISLQSLIEKHNFIPIAAQKSHMNLYYLVKMNQYYNIIIMLKVCKKCKMVMV